MRKLTKNFFSMLLVMCMLFGAVVPIMPVHAETTPSFVTKVYAFEGDAVGSIPKDFEVSNATVKVAQDGESNKALYIKGGSSKVTLKIAEQNGEFSVEFRVKYLGDDSNPSKDTQNTISLQTASSNQTATLAENNGALKAHDGKGWQALISNCEIGAWYSVKMDVDTANRKFDLAITKEGETAQIFSNLPFRTSSNESISYLVIGGSGGKTLKMYIDDIKVPHKLPDVAFDFEDDVIDAEPKYAELVTDGAKGTAKVIADSDNTNNNILWLHDKAAAAVKASFAFEDKTDSFEIGFKLKLATKNDDYIVNLLQNSDSSGDLGARLLVRGGTFRYIDSGNWVTFNENYEVNRWYSFLITANIETDTYDLYVDGKLIKAGIGFAGKVNLLNKIQFTTLGATNGDMYIDDIAVENPIKNEPVIPDEPDVPDEPVVPDAPEIVELEKYVPEYCDVQLLADGDSSTYLAFPSILKLSDEKVIIAYKASTAHMDVEADLDLIVFNPTTKQVVSETTIDGTVGEAAQNVELIQMPNGDIVAYIDVQRVTDSGQTRFGIKEIRSTDGGETWKTLASDGTYKPVSEVGKHEYKVLKDDEGIIYGYVFDEATVNGTVYMLAMSFPDFASTPGRSVHVIKSSDNGATWTHVKNLTTTFGIAFNESSIEACDGGFIVNCRKDSDGKKGVSYRTDTDFNVLVEEDYSDYADVIVTTHRPKIIEENGKYYLLGRNAVTQSVYTALVLYEIDPVTLRPLNYIELNSLSKHTYQHSYYAEYYLQEDEGGRVFFNVITYDDSRSKDYPDIVRYEYLWEELLTLTPIDLHTHIISAFDEFSGRFICVGCGKHCEHTSYTDGKCDVCGTENSNVDDAESEAICSICNSVSEYENGVCVKCGTECSHKFNLGGHCVFCGELGNAITFADGQNGGGNLSGSTNGKELTVGDNSFIHSGDTQLWDYRDAEGMLLGRDYVFTGKFTFNEYTYNPEDGDGMTRFLIWADGDVNFGSTEFALYLFGNNGKLELGPDEKDESTRLELSLNKEYDIRVAVRSEKSSYGTYTNVADVIVNGKHIWTRSFTLASSNGMAIRLGDHTTRQTLVKYDIAKDFGIHCLDSNINFIGTQEKENANYNYDLKYDLRFIFSLDNLYLDDTGIKVEAEVSGGKLFGDVSGNLALSSSRTVLNNVMVDGTVCKPGSHGAGYGGYYLALALTDIPLDTLATYTFKLTPYVVHHGGEVSLSKVSYEITVNFIDGRMNISYS